MAVKNRSNSLFLFIFLLIFVSLACRNNTIVATEATEIPDIPKQVRTAIPDEPTNTTGQADTPEPIIDTPQAVESISLVPFNYVLKDDGGGWNVGSIDIAIANTTDEIIWFKEVYLDWSPRDILVETVEGIPYGAELQWSRGGTGSIDKLYLYNLSPIIPNTWFSSEGAGIDNKSFGVVWRSASAATPTRIVFTRHPELSFDLPIERGTKISFPFISDPGSVQSIASLESVVLPMSNDKLDASFTGTCFTNDIEFGPKWYNVEFRIKNGDTFQESAGVVLLESVSLDEEGRFSYEEGTSAIFWENQAGVSTVNYPIISIGPDQSAIGALHLASSDDSYLGSVFVAVLWPDGGTTFYDVSSCPPREDP